MGKSRVSLLFAPESRYYRAVGSAEALMLKAADLGQRWMKGVSGEFALKKLREQPVPR